MSNYENGKVYQIINTVDDKMYIGSTIQSIKERIRKHKTKSKTNNNRKVYSHLNSLGWDKIKVNIIEYYPCNSKKELERRERCWIEELRPELNCIIPCRTPKEYYEEHKEEIIENTKIYQEKNKEKIAERKKIYQEKNKEKIAGKKKIYRDKNKEKIAGKKKIYYQENKEKIAKIISKKFTCVCGKTLCFGGKAKHFRSKFHINFIENKK